MQLFLEKNVLFPLATEREVKPEQKAKAWDSIELTVAGMVTEVRVVQL
jgi:hypothetical protein